MISVFPHGQCRGAFAQAPSQRDLLGTSRVLIVPASFQPPRSRPVHAQRIIGLVDRPHQTFVFKLLPVGKQDSTRKRTDQPFVREPF